MVHTVAVALLMLSLSSTPTSVPKASAPPPPPPERSDRDTPVNPESLRLKVIRQNMPQVENCLDRAHSKSSRTQGEVVVEWDITSWGSVDKAQVTSNTTRDPELADCILQLVKGWQFEERGSPSPSAFHMSHVFRLVSSQ